LASEQYDVLIADLENPGIYSADMLLLAPSPKAVLQILTQIGGRLKPGQVLVSFAAAISLARLETQVPQGVSVARVMPNAPSLIGQGMNPIVYSESASSQARELVVALLSVLGKTLEVRDEQMNWCVGLSGAAMRSLLPALEGMTQAGIMAGLNQVDARKVAAQVMLGTAAVVSQTALTFEEIKALTPMETLDEILLAQLFMDAARNAKEKIDELQRRLDVA
jgi:pyrroline-5-carboxylate reductase